MNKIITFFRSAPFNKYFWIILLIKIVFSFFFASEYMTKGFLPFVSYFIENGSNPYNYFYSLNQTVFPYPAMMLLLFSVPLFLFKSVIALFGDGGVFIQLFLMRVPILIADIAMYLILCKWLPTKEKKVLILYFASPILFYINYYHGQLDAIPTAILLLSLFALFKKKVLLSYILLGIGLATKTHLLIAIPFYFVYLLRAQKYPFGKLVLLTILSVLVFLIPNSLFYSKGFMESVFNNSEQLRIFYLSIPFGYQNIVLFIAPAIILGVFYRFLSYKKFNNDSLILSLGLVYTVLIAFVPPMQGWFYWSLPFLVYFFCKYTNANIFSFWMMSVFYLLFFIFREDSDILQSAMLIFPSLASVQIPYYLLQSFGYNPLIVQNIMFTGLEISVLMNAAWSYRIGMHYNNLYIEKQKPFIFGMGGNSGVGKSTLTKALYETLGFKNSLVVNGDDAHKWERGSEQWKVFTHLNPTGNRIHDDYQQVQSLKKGNTIERVGYNHKTGRFTDPITMHSNRFILVQGLHPFFLKNMRELFDLKIYLETSEELYKKWKTERDIKKRGYNKAVVAKEMQRRKKDFQKFILPQKEYADWVISYSLIKRKNLRVMYRFANTLDLDGILQSLDHVKTLDVRHTYQDMNYQSVTISGTITSTKIQNLYYAMYPKVDELIDHQPKFKNNINGLNQLFFLSLVNHHYLLNKENDEKNY